MAGGGLPPSPSPSPTRFIVKLGSTNPHPEPESEVAFPRPVRITGIATGSWVWFLLPLWLFAFLLGIVGLCGCFFVVS